MSRPRQQMLFGPRPRRRPRKLAHVIDAGDPGVVFHCSRCGWESDWISWAVINVSEAKRGTPCPRCNPLPIVPLPVIHDLA